MTVACGELKHSFSAMVLHSEAERASLYCHHSIRFIRDFVRNTYWTTVFPCVTEGLSKVRFTAIVSAGRCQTHLRSSLRRNNGGGQGQVFAVEAVTVKVVTADI